MKRISILMLVFFAYLVSAGWLRAQTPTPPPNVNRLIPHFPRLLRRVGPAIPPTSPTQQVVPVQCLPGTQAVGVVCRQVAGVELATLPASSQTTNSTDLVKGIGTDVSNLDVIGSWPGLDPSSSIHTSVHSVTYADPIEINDVQDQLNYFEVTGTIQGIGWGGWTEDVSNLTVAVNFSPYSYQVQFVLRYTADFAGTLIVYNHSSWLFSDVTFMENMFGPRGDDLRHVEREGDLFVSNAVLSPQRNHAYFAINSLVKADASPAAFALSGPNQGLPLMVYDDVPIERDTTQVAQRLVAKLTGKVVDLTLGTGFSIGADRALDTNRGYNWDDNWDGTSDVTGVTGVFYRSGDVYRKAYDQTSGKIFDGFIPYGSACYDDSSCRTNPENPLGSPMTMLASEDDFWPGFVMVHNAAVLQRAGVDVANSVRVYQIRTMTHNPPEAILVFPHVRIALEGPPYPPNPQGWSTYGMSVTSGDWLEPVMAAVIDNMVAYLKTGKRMPPSLIDGTIVAGSPPYVDYPQFSRLPGSPPSKLYSQLVPFIDDPSLDSMVGLTQWSTATEADWGWSLVDDINDLRSVMPNREQSLVLPLTACRQGGFIDFYGYFLGFPGPFPDMKKIWGSLDNYEDCVQQTIASDVNLGVYDEEIGEQVAQRTSPSALF